MHGRLALAAVLIALAAFLGITSGTQFSSAAPPPTAAFDWTMPDRLHDQDGDGLIDQYFDGDHSPADLNPTSWTVNFDACESAEGSSPIAEYRWSVDGEDAGVSGECDGFSHDFPAEGVYQVTLTVVDAEAQESSVTQDVTVQDWLIVALGDSYGSGEGNPDVPVPAIAFDNYYAALADLQEAQADLNAAVATLLSVQSNYNLTVARANAVRSALTALNNANSNRNFLCNPLNFPSVVIPGSTAAENCANAVVAVNIARANLLSALATLGQQSLIDTLGVINETMNDLVAVAQQAVNVAQSAVNVAQAAVTDAQAALANVASGAQPTWKDRQCHRSAVAGSAQAALMIEKADPRTSVTFVHLACSGAKITTGLLDPYAGQEPGPGDSDLPPQVQTAALMLEGREVDALYMSIGGNDMHFADIVKACITQEQCNVTPTKVQTGIDGVLTQICAPLAFATSACNDYFTEMKAITESGLEYYNEGIALLAPRYVSLGNDIATSFPDMPPDRVYLSEYPNATQTDSGAYCPDPDDPNPLASLPGVSQEELEWADQTVAHNLNRVISEAASPVSEGGEGWNLVDGIYDGFADHGYCAVDHWLVRIQETFLSQRNATGAVHPNAAGHGLYRNRIFTSLMSDFYPAGDLTAPRAPTPQAAPPEPPAPVEVTDELAQAGAISVGYSPAPAPNAPAGVYTISGAGTNESDTPFSKITFVTTFLTDGCVILNADGGPQGVGSTLTLEGDDFGDDGILSPGESFTVTVNVGLSRRPPFQLGYEVWATPVE